MSKYDLRIKARFLRKKGLPITKICTTLKVSKSSVSLWCRDIILSPSQYEKIRFEKFRKLNKGRLIGAEMNKNKRLNAIKFAEEYANSLIKDISKNEMLLVATALYWSEGSKSERSSGFQFINSDPEMVLFIKKFLVHVMGVKKADLVCAIQINALHKNRINKVLNYWKNLLNLQNEQFRSPYFIRSKIKKVYENHDSYYGICRLMVRKSTNLKYKMLGLIKALKNVNVMSG